MGSQRVRHDQVVSTLTFEWLSQNSGVPDPPNDNKVVTSEEHFLSFFFFMAALYGFWSLVS